ncbi:hypothetical protein ACIRU3_40420 [Streptomyces sp. NPDC101151]
MAVLPRIPLSKASPTAVVTPHTHIAVLAQDLGITRDAVRRPSTGPA